MKKFLPFLLVMCCHAFLVAQDTTQIEDLSELSLEDLMNVSVNVASQKASSVRETPGSITVITEEDIRNSGAVEIMELLMLVPGFEPTRDYAGNITLGVRGLNTVEGKTLFMVDGQMLNETSYGSIVLKNRIPVNQIKRIEIIRGPGSVIYGGVASLAVISVITKSGEDQKGFSVASNYGYSEGSTSGGGAELSAGKKFGDLDLAVHAAWKQHNQSNRLIFDQGLPISYADSSRVKNALLKLRASYKGLSVTGMMEQYHVPYTYGYPGVGSSKIATSFSGMYLGAEYKWKVSEKFSLTPNVQWKKQDPWNDIGDSTVEALGLESYRTQAGLKSTITLNDKISILMGTEYYQLKSTYLNNYDTIIVFSTTEKPSISLSNMAGFAEVIYNSRYGNLMAGARFDNHSTAGSAFVPRVAYTKAWKKFHIKATFSRSFRTPVIYNVDINPDLKPEFVTVLELETGVALYKNMYLTLNGYSTTVQDAIVYNTDLDGNYTYLNGESVETRGVEASWQWTTNRINARLSFAHYTPFNNKVPSFEYENRKDVLMGIPNNKLSALVSVSLHPKCSVSSSLICVGTRYSYAYDSVFNLVPYSMDPSVIWNAFVTGKNLGIKGLSLQVGVKDILNTGYTVGMAYQDGFSNVPFMRRELTARLVYTFVK